MYTMAKYKCAISTYNLLSYYRRRARNMMVCDMQKYQTTFSTNSSVLLVLLVQIKQKTRKKNPKGFAVKS